MSVIAQFIPKDNQKKKSKPDVQQVIISQTVGLNSYCPYNYGQVLQKYKLYEHAHLSFLYRITLAHLKWAKSLSQDHPQIRNKWLKLAVHPQANFN